MVNSSLEAVFSEKTNKLQNNLVPSTKIHARRLIQRKSVFSNNKNEDANAQFFSKFN